MIILGKIALLLAMSASLAVLSGCEKKEVGSSGAGPAEQAGQQLDKAAGRAGEELNKAADKAGKGLQQLGQKIESEAEQAKQEKKE